MVSRCSILALFAVAMIAVSVNAAPVEDTETEIHEDDERIKVPKFVKEAAKMAVETALKEAVEYLKEKAQNINLDCVKEIYDTCKINPVLHPKKYYKCAKRYFVEHMEHCYHSE